MDAGGRGSLLAFLALTALPAIIAAFFVPSAWWVAVLVIVTTFLIWLILPSRYELYSERLRLVFPAFTWDIGFDSIEAIQPGSLANAFAYWGVRFAAAPGQAVVIRRKRPSLLKRPHIVISPVDRERFLSQAQAALAAFRRMGP